MREKKKAQPQNLGVPEAEQSKNHQNQMKSNRRKENQGTGLFMSKESKIDATEPGNVFTLLISRKCLLDIL